MNASTGIGYPFPYVEPLKKRPNPYCRSGSERFVAHQCERRSIPLGIWLRQNSNGLPKTPTLRPRPSRWAAVDNPYGPAPTTTASYPATDTDCERVVASEILTRDSF